MTQDIRPAGVQASSVTGSGNIVGEITESQVITVTGDQNVVRNTQTAPVAADDLPLKQLRKELAAVLVRLERVHDPAYLVDRDDAIEAVCDLEKDVTSAQASAPGAPTNFRRRVKELIGVLAPVAEVIGGIAALQEIVTHL